MNWEKLLEFSLFDALTATIAVAGAGFTWYQELRRARELRAARLVVTLKAATRRPDQMDLTVVYEADKYRRGILAEVRVLRPAGVAILERTPPSGFQAAGPAMPIRQVRGYALVELPRFLGADSHTHRASVIIVGYGEATRAQIKVRIRDLAKGTILASETEYHLLD